MGKKGKHMGFIAIDLGTTNIKVAAFNDHLDCLSIVSENVTYQSNGDFVEFDAEAYFELVFRSILQCCESSFAGAPYPIYQIILTGQAESLVTLDENNKPVRPAISWLDMRSKEECEELSRHFDSQTCYRITGQPEIIPTWPITKILWLRRHEPGNFSRVSRYLLLKDYIQFRLTGIFAGEFSIYNFSHYFNIHSKEFWLDILQYCGISRAQLPDLVEPCTVLGPVKSNLIKELGMDAGVVVNVGTLDHFAGMIGTGNIREGLISESTGTVLSIATLVNNPDSNQSNLPLHYGPFKDTYVYLPVCESGGISLEWFKKGFLPEMSYSQINEEAAKRAIPNELVFLPYITGVNAPDFNPDATGVFFGIQTKHDPIDFAVAIMEGVAHLLKKNMDFIEKAGFRTDMIISTGGGARSEIWSQMKADLTRHTVAIPENEEAACLGAAMIGAVSAGIFTSYEEAVKQCVTIKKVFHPQPAEGLAKKHDLFNMLFDQTLPVYHLAARG
jgi:sugar (pentulose or hexulose) kinase